MDQIPVKRFQYIITAKWSEHPRELTSSQTLYPPQNGFIFPSTTKDKRIFFVLPWRNTTLIGTTEVLETKHPDSQRPSYEEINYLLDNYNAYHINKLKYTDIKYCFSGLRWLAKKPKFNLSETSRESLIVSKSYNQAKMWIIYGGKLTSYRSLSKKIGDQICDHLNINSPSQTHLKKYWMDININDHFHQDLEDDFDLRFIKYDHEKYKYQFTI